MGLGGSGDLGYRWSFTQVPIKWTVKGGEWEDIDYQLSALSTEKTWAKTLDHLALPRDSLPNESESCQPEPDAVESHEDSDFV